MELRGGSLAYEGQFNPDGCLENGAHPYVTLDVMLAVVRALRNGHLREAEHLT